MTAKKTSKSKAAPKKHALPKHPKKPGHANPKKDKRSLEERLMEWDDDDDDAPALHISETMRTNLLKEEFKLRKKQPTAWTKTKYRKFAFFNTGKKKEVEKVHIQEEHEIESDQKKKDKIKNDKQQKKK